MHATAARIGARFFELYTNRALYSAARAGLRGGAPRILDVGALNINGSLRQSAPPGSEYLGVDYQDGPGVDLVVMADAPLPFEDDRFDLVVSTSAFEHDPAFWLTFPRLLRVLAPGGLLYLNAPSNGFHHGHPVDCWRFYPDAGRALSRWGRLCGFDCELVESFIASRAGETEPWNDFVAVFSKTPPSSRREPEPPKLALSIEGSTCIARGEDGPLERYDAETEDGQRLGKARGLLRAWAERRGDASERLVEETRLFIEQP